MKTLVFCLSKGLILFFIMILISCQSTENSNSASNTMNTFFPINNPYNKTETSKLFTSINIINSSDSSLNYTLNIPFNWKEYSSSIKLGTISPQHPFQEQLWLHSPSIPHIEAKVSLVLTPYEESPRDWLENQLNKMGEKILHARYLSTNGGEQPDVLTISSMTNISPRISRWIVLKDSDPNNGARLYILRVSAAAADYSHSVSNIFYIITHSFKLIHPTNWVYAEKLRTLVRIVPTNISTVFPLSWQQKENPMSDEHFYQVKLSKELNSRHIGLINLILTSDQGEVEMRRIEDKNRQAYQQVDKLEFAPTDFKPAPRFNNFEQVFLAVTPQINVPAGAPSQERQVLLASTGKYWVLLENIRFTQTANPTAWAISKRGFDIVKEHLVIKP